MDPQILASAPDKVRQERTEVLPTETSHTTRVRSRYNHLLLRRQCNIIHLSLVKCRV